MHQLLPWFHLEQHSMVEIISCFTTATELDHLRTTRGRLQDGYSLNPMTCHQLSKPDVYELVDRLRCNKQQFVGSTGTLASKK